MQNVPVAKQLHENNSQTFELFIDGDYRRPKSGQWLPTFDPTVAKPWAQIADAGDEDVNDAVNAALAAFDSDDWRGISASRRGRLLMRLGDEVAAHAEQLAELETRENGKLYREMLQQLRAIPEWLYYFGGLADKIEGRVIPVSRQTVLNYSLREPVGVVAAIVPWNSPVFLAITKLAPVLASGNTIILKPSEHASASVIQLGRLAESAGIPRGVINVLTGGPSTGDSLIRHSGVARVSFTGGPAAARAVAAAVGSRLARCTLELGGKSSNIVFGDAPIEAAEAGTLAGIFAAAGQSCVAGSRLLVESAIFEEFVDQVTQRARAIRVGHPMDPEVDMGPLATAAQLARVEAVVQRARDEGGVILCGGDRIRSDTTDEGWFYAPTIVRGLANSADAAQHEIFGPVLVTLPFSDEAEAVALANSTAYGLACGVWTSNLQRAHRVARQLQVGTVWVNTYRSLTYNSPFGGYKASGVGRENGIEAIDEFLQTKSVWCELDTTPQDPFTVRIS